MVDFVLWCVKCDVGGGMGRVWIRLSTVGNLNLTHLLVGLKMSIQPNPTQHASQKGQTEPLLTSQACLKQ